MKDKAYYGETRRGKTLMFDLSITPKRERVINLWIYRKYLLAILIFSIFGGFAFKFFSK